MEAVQAWKISMWECLLPDRLFHDTVVILYFLLLVLLVPIDMIQAFDY